jgi:hypothetical protein
MKRLIKKSEFYNATKLSNNTVEIFKNPSSSEILEIKKMDGDIRGLWYYDGTVYAWESKYLHDDLINIFKDLDFNQPHFFTEGADWIRFHLDEKGVNYKFLKSALLKNKSILNNIVNINSAILDFYEDETVKLEDFLNDNSINN